MVVTMLKSNIAGEIEAIPSKSHLHRLLICASLAQTPTEIICKHANAHDIDATVACCEAIGANVVKKENGYFIEPIDYSNLPKEAVLPCKESGSTFRFMLPIVCALGITGTFEMEGRLPERPIKPLDRELEKFGIRLSKPCQNTIKCEGKLQPGAYTLPGNVSSQYISGLLMALPLLKQASTLEITETAESKDYIEITLDVLREFGASPKIKDNIYYIEGNTCLLTANRIQTDGDWSNSGFWLCCAAMPECKVILKGINKDSKQGDRRIAEIISKIGADVLWENTTVKVSENQRNALVIDAREIPDLIPCLSAVLAVANGTSFIKNAARLRIKESDRLATTASVLNALGANITELEDGLLIEGVTRLKGGRVDAHIDHRIAMTAAVASLACDEKVVLTGANAVSKSYPKLWEDFKALGKNLIVEK